MRGQFAFLLNPDVILQPSAVARLTRVHDNPPGRGRRGPAAPRSRRDGTGLRPPGSFRLDRPVRALGAADPPVPQQPREPARAARALGRRTTPRSRSTGSPAPVSSRAGRPGKRSGSSTSGSSSSGRTRTGVYRFRRAGWGVYYVPAASGTHLVGISRAGRRLGSVRDFHVSAYRYYRKHRAAARAPSPDDAGRGRAPGQSGAPVRAGDLDSPATLDGARGRAGSRQR